jgi:hypothetical protein
MSDHLFRVGCAVIGVEFQTINEYAVSFIHKRYEGNDETYSGCEPYTIVPEMLALKQTVYNTRPTTPSLIVDIGL